MGFTIIDLINLIALFVSIAGTFIMFYFSPVTNSQVFIYKKAEIPIIKKRDAYKNKMMRFGFRLILIACLLQAIAIFLNIVSK
jgi:hypothetical protein